MNLLNMIKERITTEKTYPVSPINDNVSSHAPTLNRQRTLHQMMTSIRDSAFDDIAAICPEGFTATQQMLEAESTAARLYGLVMAGKSMISDYQAVVESWIIIVKNELDKEDPE